MEITGIVRKTVTIGLKNTEKYLLNPAKIPNNSPETEAIRSPTNNRNIVLHITVKESILINILPNANNTPLGVGSSKVLSTIALAIIQTRNIKKIDSVVIPVFFKFITYILFMVCNKNHHLEANHQAVYHSYLK